MPSTYVVCERDNAIPPAAQEHMSAHAGTVSRLEAGHSPFLSRPHDVTAIIQETAGRGGGGGARGRINRGCVPGQAHTPMRYEWPMRAYSGP